MSTTTMSSNERADSVWVMHPPRTRDSMYSSQLAVGQNKVIPTITPSPIPSIHAKQRYRLEEVAPNSRKRALIDILTSQRPPIPVMIPVADLDSDPDFRVATRPSLDRTLRPLFRDGGVEDRQRQMQQEARLRLTRSSEADAPQVSRIFPTRCVPKGSQSQPRTGPKYVAPGPSSLRQYVVYETPSPEVSCATYISSLQYFF